MAELNRTRQPVPERPALSPWLRVVAGDKRLLLEHGGTVAVFDGRAAELLLPSLLPLLDGTRTVNSIVAALGNAIGPATRNALEVLNENGALLDGPQPSGADGPASEAALFAAASNGTSPAEALARLSTSSVAVSGASPTATEIVRILTDTQLERVRAVDGDDPGDPAELLIAAPSPSEVAVLDELNARRLADAAPWIQVLPNDGHIVAIGPLFVPDASGCYACYCLRRGACSGFERDFERIARVPPKAGSPTPLALVSAGVAGLVALRWLATRDATLPGRFYSLETDVVLALRSHQLLRVPRCPVCGAGDAPMPSPWFDVHAHDD